VRDVEPTISELRSIVPATQPGRRIAWAKAEAALGVTFPEDYKRLSEEWGAGTFDHFLWVFEPGHPNRYADLLSQFEGPLEALRQVGYELDELPAMPEVMPGGLLLWGVTDNGDAAYWHIGSADPASWTVAINESRGPDWHRPEAACGLYRRRLVGRREGRRVPGRLP
jgi:hypothetical protein